MWKLWLCEHCLFFNRVDGVYLLSLNMFGAEFGFADVPVNLSFKEEKSP